MRYMTIPLLLLLLVMMPFGKGAVGPLGQRSLPCGGVQQAPLPHHQEPYSVDSGVYNGGVGIPDRPDFRAVVRVPGATWIRLHFGDYNLGERSYLTITSLKDGRSQHLNARSIGHWGGSSAFFNGDAVEIRLHVAPEEQNVFFRVVRVTVGDPVESARDLSTADASPQSICGSTDDRVASGDPRVGRLVPVGCTGWITSNGVHLTAGHCATPTITMQVLEFNVPSSECNGQINHPDPADQYPVDQSSIIFSDDGRGDDWAVFDCFPSSETGLLPVQAQMAFYRMSRDDSPTTLRVTGYGRDNVPVGCTGDRNADSQTEQTDSGPYLGENFQGDSIVWIEHQVDTDGGNSGSPLIVEGTTTAIGIHTNGGCSVSDGSNAGTSFENDDLENAVQTFPGANMMYVDGGHPTNMEDGTVFRPYKTVGAAVLNASGGERISIVTGSYNETLTVDKDVILEAPVGVVTIGQ